MAGLPVTRSFQPYQLNVWKFLTYKFFQSLILLYFIRFFLIFAVHKHIAHLVNLIKRWVALKSNWLFMTCEYSELQS